MTFVNDARRLADTLKAAFADPAGPALVLATIVRTAGSTYRKAGAQMLVPAGAAPIGILSGGCLEDDIVKAARSMIAKAPERGVRTKLMFFDLMPESEFLVGYGKGCSGQMTVLLELVDPTDAALARTVDPDRPTPFALVFAAGGGLSPGQRVFPGDPAAAAFGDAFAGAAAKAQSIDLPSGAKACIYTAKPPLDLMLFGAGPDAPALARFADQLGWSVHVLDHRPARLDAARFPAGTTLTRYNPETLGDDIATTPRTAVVVMTHNLLVDAEVLKWAAARPLLYLGLLGPSQRRERLYRWLLSQGTDLEPQLQGRLHSPIGLDLGATDGGEWEIALAIVAQIQQSKNAALHAASPGANAFAGAPQDAIVVDGLGALDTAAGDDHGR
jgi:xanthine/CO dehydrogenase XdhC/CoxF family maturation factor